MMVDPHDLQRPLFQLPLLCLLWKAAPNILWSLGGAAHNQFLLLRRDNPAIIAVRIWLMPVLADYRGKPQTSKEVDTPAHLDYRAPQ